MMYFQLRTGKSIATEFQYSTRSIMDCWKIFYHHGHCIEIRALLKNTTITGFFDSKTDFIRYAKFLSGKCIGVYVTINPVPEDCLSLYEPNKMVTNNPRLKYDEIVYQGGHLITSTDHDIRYEASIVVDIDPIRKSGVSSNDNELKQAIIIAQSIESYLEQLNIPVYLACSGNGFHLILLLPLTPVDDTTVRKRRNLLKRLNEKFGTDSISIDQKIFNLARIIRLYGTASRKGYNNITLGRVHRLSWIHKYPHFDRVDSWEILDKELDLKDPELTPLYRNTKVYDIEALLNASRLAYRKKKDGLWELQDCPASPGGHKPWEATVIQQPNGAVSFQCFHDRCSHWNWKTFREYLEKSLMVNVMELRE